MNILRNFKLYRWLKGGLWVLLDDHPHWLHAVWLDASLSGEFSFIHDERGNAYHCTYNGIIKIESWK